MLSKIVLQLDNKVQFLYDVRFFNVLFCTNCSHVRCSDLAEVHLKEQLIIGDWNKFNGSVANVKCFSGPRVEVSLILVELERRPKR